MNWLPAMFRVLLVVAASAFLVARSVAGDPVASQTVTPPPTPTAAPSPSPSPEPSPSPSPSPVPITGLGFTSDGRVVWDDPGLGQSAIRVFGSKFYVASCELVLQVGQVPPESVEFDEMLPGNATSYRLPLPRDSRLEWVPNSTATVQALSETGQLLAQMGINVAASFPACVPKLPTTGAGSVRSGTGGSTGGILAGGATLALAGVLMAYGALHRERRP